MLCTLCSCSMPCCDEASHKVSVRWSAQSPASMKKYCWNERNASITLSSSLNSLHEMKGVAFATWATSHVHKEGVGCQISLTELLAMHDWA